jgi:hypothetical protein
MILHRTRGPTLEAHNMVANELQRQSQRIVPHVQLNIRDHPVLIQANQLMVMPRQRAHSNAAEKPYFRYFQISVNSTGSHKNPRRTQQSGLPPRPAAAISGQSSRRGQISGWKARATFIHSCPFVSIRGSKPPLHSCPFVVKNIRRKAPSGQISGWKARATEAILPSPP